jgi:hypothetical protein
VVGSHPTTGARGLTCAHGLGRLPSPQSDPPIVHPSDGVAPACAMILAISPATRILTGLSVLGVGLFLLTLYMLTVQLRQEKLTRHSARGASSQVSQALTDQPSEPTLTGERREARQAIGWLIPDIDRKTLDPETMLFG